MDPLANLSVLLPEALLLGVTLLVMLLDLFGDPQDGRPAVAAALAGLAAVTVVLVHGPGAGGVHYAFGGMFVSDPMTLVLKVAAVAAAALALVSGRLYCAQRQIARGEFQALVLFALLGILLMISANNLLMIYLGLELQSLSLYALVALRRDDRGATEAAMKYFVLGALASGFLLYGMSMLYGATGTLDINDLAHRITAGQSVSVALVLGALFIVAGIAFKLGAAPFHVWVPDVYEGAPTPAALLLASAPKLAAFAVTFRILVEGLPQFAVDWQHMIAFVAVLSLAVGNITAVAQTNLKRMLGFSTVGQMGFLLLALLAGVTGGNLATTAGAYGAAMFYVVTYAVATAGCFGIILVLSREGFEADAIADLRGLARHSPWFASVMTLLMLSLAGLPPTVGFAAKFVVLQALVSDGAGSTPWLLAVTGVLFSFVGAFYYLRVIKVMWFDAAPDSPQPLAADGALRAVLSVNGLAVLVLGILPQGLLALCNGAVLRTLGG
jgi:NADH-quinone oxidoreductase subunit N